MSSKAVLHEHHKGEDEVEKEQEDGVAQKTEDNSVEGRANNEQKGAEDVLAGTAGFSVESSAEESPVRTDRETTDLAVAKAPQDRQENNPWDDESKRDTAVENDGYQRKAQDDMHAHVTGLRLGNGGDQDPSAAERGATDSLATATQPGSEQEDGEDKDVEEVAATTVETQHGESGADLSIGGRASDAESPASENALEPEGDAASLRTTALPDNDEERRGASSRDRQIGDKVEEEGTAAGTAVGLKAEGPNDKAAGPAGFGQAGRALSSAMSVSLDEDGRAWGQGMNTAEKESGGQELGDHERGVAEKTTIAPALVQDEDVAGGGLQRAVEPTPAPSSSVPEGAGSDDDGGADAAAGEDCGGETAAEVVAPPPASHCNPPTTRTDDCRGAMGGDVSFAGRIVVEEGVVGAGGFLGVLKEIFQKGGSCCR